MSKRRGRPSKAGKRRPNGRLIHEPSIVQPSEWVAQMRARFGNYYSTALGRAFVSGLLGEGNEAKDRYDNACKFVRLYTRFIGGSAYRCPLNDTPRGGNVVEIVTERQGDDHAWLMANLGRLDRSGGRPYFDQLISSLHTDSGPYWADALIDGGKHPADLAVLAAALKALDSIGSVNRQAAGPERMAC